MKKIAFILFLIFTTISAQASTWYWCNDPECSTPNSQPNHNACLSFIQSHGGYCRLAPRELVPGSINSINNTTDLKKTCLYESKSYSLGSKIQFTFNMPTTGIVVIEVLECIEANEVKNNTDAYWKSILLSCKNPMTNKVEACQ